MNATVLWCRQVIATSLIAVGLFVLPRSQRHEFIDAVDDGMRIAKLRAELRSTR